jgi:spermidine synthase
VSLLAEIALTRVVSYVLFYAFAYFLIGFALLGLGMGAAWVALKPHWEWTAERSARCLLAFVVGLVLALAALAWLPLNMRDVLTEPAQVPVWLALAVGLAAPFVSSGILLSTAFRASVVRPGSLYAADLVAAASASVLAVAMLSTIGPVRALGVAGLVAVGMATVLSPHRVRAALGGAVLLAVLAGFGAQHLTVFRPAVGKQMNTFQDQPIVFAAWHALFRIDVTREWKLPAGLLRRDLWHDGNLGSAFLSVPDGAGARAWDGTLKQVPFLVTEKPRVLVIGAAGGGDLAIALHYGAEHVTGVELHPVTSRLMREGFADFTGGLAADPRVDYLTAEGRRFVDLTDRSFDLIQLVSPDSYAAQPGAAQVLVENYLYTREAFRGYWNALAPDGILALEIGDLPKGTTRNSLRLVAQARDLLERAGVADPENHIAVVGEGASWFVVSQVMVSKSPFSAERIEALRRATTGGNMRLVWVPGMEKPGPAIASLARGGDAADLGRFGMTGLDLRPVSDDRPFFFTYYSWGPLLTGTAAWGLAREYATGQYLVLALLVVSGVAVFAVVLLPLTFRARPVGLGRAWSVGLAVVLMGWGFLAIEVNSIQRLTLYLGYPTYALTTVLTGILLGAGFGSAWSGRVGPRRALLTGCVIVVGSAVAALVVLPVLTRATFAQPLAVRAVLASAWSLVQGFGLGVFFPTALAILAGWGAQWVAWGWTLNGMASVFGSALAVLLAMVMGFGQTALVAAAGYVVITVLLLRSTRDA